ncbi:MAG: diaminopimelate epimerase [Proteobacteria bacterium]|nr:diaminopimelate epimerase [Pseudomonadota bacterium]
MHGCGNDFIVVDAREVDISGLLADKPTLAKLCDRHFGVGCDQFIAIANSQTADAEMLIHNADGSPAGMCGNAARCVADIILKETGKPEITLSVGSRRLQCWRDGDVTIDMGAPASIGEAKVLDALPKAVTVDMGNPHAVFVVDDAEKIELEKIGPIVENDAQFPNRTNVEFISREGAGLRMRVWERGAGVTLACGSGACAAIVAAVTKGITPRKTAIRMDGGTLQMEWRESDGHVLMAGPVTYVFKGTLL